MLRVQFEKSMIYEKSKRAKKKKKRIATLGPCFLFIWTKFD